MIILIFLLVFIAVFVSMYNSFIVRKSKLAQLLTGMDSLLLYHCSLSEKWLHFALPFLPDGNETLLRLTDFHQRLKARNNNPDDKIVLYNRYIDIIRGIRLALQDNTEFKQQPPHSVDAELQKHEEEIHSACAAYNDTAREYNDLVKKFPTNIIAFLFKQRRTRLFEIDPA